MSEDYRIFNLLGFFWSVGNKLYENIWCFPPVLVTPFLLICCEFSGAKQLSSLYDIRVLSM